MFMVRMEAISLSCGIWVSQWRQFCCMRRIKEQNLATGKLHVSKNTSALSDRTIAYKFTSTTAPLSMTQALKDLQHQPYW